MRLALGALGGIFLFMAGDGALWAWVGACFVMLSVAGADAAVGAAAGAIAGAISYFRLLEFRDTDGIFWILLVFQAGGGALFGALASEISRKLPPAAFALVAALLPAGLEHLGTFMASGNLLSTALTQYTHPTVVKMARLGGMAGVTWIIFVFGGAAAMAVRYVREGEVLAKSTVGAAGVVVIALMYGAASSAQGDRSLVAVAYSPESLFKERDRLAAQTEYDEEAWKGYMDRLLEEISDVSDRPVTLRALDRRAESAKPDVMVWPEAAVIVNDDLEKEFLDRLAAVVRNTGCVQIAAYYDLEEMTSNAVIAGGPNVEAGYSRLCYVPTVDDVFMPEQIAVPGLQPPRAYDTPHGRMGALLSFDANFVSNFKEVARDGGVFAGVCALNDRLTPQVSLELLVYNAALSGVGVMRCARQGALVAISPDGEILAGEESSEKANTQLQAEVPEGTAATFFLAVGNAFAWLALAGGLAAGLYASSLEERPLPGLRQTEEEGTGPISFRTREGMRRL